jgi:hypothetical protein
MESYLTTRPSAPAAAGFPVTHEPVVGRFAVRITPAAAQASGPRLRSDDGISVSTGRQVAGMGIPMAAKQLTSDVRGVPPRGRPV